MATAGFAQCDPDFSFPDGVAFGLSPDPLADETFADGYLGEDYADTIHMLIPLDATELVGAPAPVDSIVVQSISLIGESGESLLIADVGLELTPNNNGDSPNLFTFMGGGQYCATLTGIPDTTGTFQASIEVDGWTTVFGSPFDQEVSFDGYTLTLILEGCTDETACNYESLATIDDGSCAELDALNECGGDCLADEDEDGICDDVDDCIGAFDALGECNGPCEADTDENGICDSEEGLGCMDEMACNYDDTATEENGTCEYPADYYDCDGLCINDEDEDGVCDELEIVGCIDQTACNYDATATDEDNASCTYPEEFYDCDGNCLNDADSDGVCDELEVQGCTNVYACNFDQLATDDDMSCELPGDPCDDMDAETTNDSLNADCDCVGDPVSLILEQEDLSLKVYPNPTMGELIIVLPVGHAFDLTLVSLSGQTVLSSQTTKGGPVVWEVEGVPAGAYLLHVRNEHATAVRRVLVGGR